MHSPIPYNMIENAEQTTEDAQWSDCVQRYETTWPTIKVSMPPKCSELNRTTNVSKIRKNRCRRSARGRFFTYKSVDSFEFQFCRSSVERLLVHSARIANIAKQFWLKSGRGTRDSVNYFTHKQFIASETVSEQEQLPNRDSWHIMPTHLRALLLKFNHITSHVIFKACARSRLEFVYTKKPNENHNSLEFLFFYSIWCEESRHYLVRHLG